MTFDSNSFDVQRWHSTEYVDDWIANQEQEEGRRSLRRKLVSLLALDTEVPIRVLDIGAGGGALSKEILNRYPLAQIVCQDFSEAMLAQARRNLASFSMRTTFAQSDLAASKWTQPVSGLFEAVVSSLVMHTVPGRVRDIYGEVSNLVKPGGCFVLADNVVPGPMLEKVYLRERLLARQAKIKAETGIEKSLEEIRLEMRERWRSQYPGDAKRVRNPARINLTLMNHLEWLQQAGFDEVDCLWKEMRHMVIGGFKHSK